MIRRTETPRTRRALLILVGAGMLVAPFAILAQTPPAKIRRVGFLDHDFARDSPGGRTLAAFQRGMRELGYIEGKDYQLELRAAEGNDQLAMLAGQLVKLKVDVIVASGGSPAIRAAMQATTTIPIVMATGDPVGSGFVASLAHPGGNVTGLSIAGSNVSEKYIEMLKAILPALSRVGVLGDPDSSTYPAIVKAIDATASKATVETIHLRARSTADVEHAFLAFKKNKVDAVVIAPGSFLVRHYDAIAALAVKYRLPSSGSAAFASRGGLLGYGVRGGESYRLAAAYVDKIFKGANPGDLPVEQFREFDLVINAKTAKQLGLAIPHELLVRADEVIE